MTSSLPSGRKWTTRQTSRSVTAENVLQRLGFSLLHALFAMVTLTSCASTQLEADQNHPASPAAASAPLPPMGNALDPGFDPQGPDSESDSAPSGMPGHQHGGPKAAPPAGEPAAPGNDGASNSHGGHEGKQTAPANGSTDAEPAWTCSMHPQVIQPKPGKCPICGMKLKPVAPKSVDGEAH